MSWRNIVEKHDKGMVIALFNRHLFVYGLELSNMKSCTLGKSGAAHSSQMCLAWQNLVERQKAKGATKSSRGVDKAVKCVRENCKIGQTIHRVTFVSLKTFFIHQQKRLV